ncbi:hypothetical protein F9278_16000 [Streptomyces phaeolivaceus]|uniref:Uncharacterized protein n=2 Tax=Streptomyces phaeolivaceus TaxID=2653200 RepID=A0A5P8KHG2_9ACTN|nr:hypothetical protein F9278_16000 [Streptomyces phaeolivaceus]
MYQEMRSLHDVVTRVDSKLDALAGQAVQINDHENRLRSLEAMPKTTDIEPRVATLERSRWPLPSVAAATALGALGVALWQAVGR